MDWKPIIGVWVLFLVGFLLSLILNVVEKRTGPIRNLKFFRSAFFPIGVLVALGRTFKLPEPLQDVFLLSTNFLLYDWARLSVWSDDKPGHDAMPAYSRLLLFLFMIILSSMIGLAGNFLSPSLTGLLGGSSGYVD